MQIAVLRIDLGTTTPAPLDWTPKAARSRDWTCNEIEASNSHLACDFVA